MRMLARGDNTQKVNHKNSSCSCKFFQEMYHQGNKAQKQEKTIYLAQNILLRSFIFPLSSLMKEALVIICVVLLGFYVAQSVVATGLVG